jgi:hypothetical protein
MKRKKKPNSQSANSNRSDDLLTSEIGDSPFGIPRSIRSDDNRFMWLIDRPYCAACWIPGREAMYHRTPGRLEIHEVIGGPMRSLETCNYLNLCSKCHDSYHSRANGLTLEQMLGFKWEQSCLDAGKAIPYETIIVVDEVEVWNPYRLSYLRRPERNPPSLVALPSPETGPPSLIQERSRWSHALQAGSVLTESQWLSLAQRSVSVAPIISPTYRYIGSSDGSGLSLSRAGRLDTWTPSPSP